uniref:Uncharacterized protein n=1 Tax=Arundo donax TaxID=35708 RepID=A0A0A9CJP5_ARUDO
MTSESRYIVLGTQRGSRSAR